jgi:hypothetical protein
MKNLKKIPSAGKIMIIVFCDCEGVILLDVMPRWQTINSDAYIKTLKILKKCFQQV